MTARIHTHDLQVATELYRFVEDEVLPESGIDSDRFWRGFAAIVRDFAPKNRALLAERDRLQTAIDEWHGAHPGPIADMPAYRGFLESIGYLQPVPSDVKVHTANVDAEIAAIVRHHHERVDGNGYPDRLENEDIPLLARIIAVADAYNAMTSDRPYRDAMPSRVARLRLAQAVDSQFDTAVVAAFEAILTSESEDYRTATDPEFVLMAPRSFERSRHVADEAAVVAVAAAFG